MVNLEVTKRFLWKGKGSEDILLLKWPLMVKDRDSLQANIQ